VIDDIDTAFYRECAEREGKTLEQLTEDDKKFWSGDDGNV